MDTNVVVVQGRLGKDPELRTLPNSDDKLLTIGIANSSWKQVNSEWKEETSWFDVTFFGRQAEAVAEKCKKGSRIVITGSLKQRSWEDKDGNKRSAIGITARQVAYLDKQKKTESVEAEAPRDSVPF